MNVKVTSLRKGPILLRAKIEGERRSFFLFCGQQDVEHDLWLEIYNQNKAALDAHAEQGKVVLPFIAFVPPETPETPVKRKRGRPRKNGG